jgi:hypothetical protein
MKIKLIGYETLARPLSLEGHEIISDGEDVVLNEDAETNIPKKALELLGVEVSLSSVELFRTTIFYDHVHGFGEQMLLGIPLNKFLCEDLGTDCFMGMVTKFVQSGYLKSFYVMIEELLHKMRHFGYVTIKFGDDFKPIEARRGLGEMLFNVLEGFKGSVVDLMTTKVKLLESWTSSLVISRYPYPMRDMAEPELQLRINPAAEKHLWFYNIYGYRSALYTKRTRVCVATAWAQSVSDVCNRVYRTARELELPDKQYRTDMFKKVCLVLGLITARVDDGSSLLSTLDTPSGDQRAKDAVDVILVDSVDKAIGDSSPVYR